MVRQPLYNRVETEYNIRVYIVDGCGSSASFIPVTFFMRRNNRPPIFQVSALKNTDVYVCSYIMGELLKVWFLWAIGLKLFSKKCPCQSLKRWKRYTRKHDFGSLHIRTCAQILYELFCQWLFCRGISCYRYPPLLFYRMSHTVYRSVTVTQDQSLQYWLQTLIQTGLLIWSLIRLLVILDCSASIAWVLLEEII